MLSNISFTSRPGETVAIIGSTGSGKTSLVNLVARLFDVTTGEVLIDGIDVRQIDPELLWNRIGLVPQKPYLFSGTVASNLRYGKPDATEEEIWAALEVAQATDFVTAMPGDVMDRVGRGFLAGTATAAIVLAVLCTMTLKARDPDHSWTLPRTA